MRVKFKEPDSEIWSIGIVLSETNKEGLFSVDDLLLETTLAIDEMYQEINRLCECDVFERVDHDWSKRPDSNDRVYCICEHDLSYGREYEILSIEADNYRILCDGIGHPGGREPVLFNRIHFEIVETTKPEIWKQEYGEDGELYAFPSSWKKYFFENYFDGDEEVISVFWSDLRRYYPWTAKEIES